MENRKFGFETLQLRAGQEIDPVSKATAVPIYQTTAYVFEDMQQGADLFALKKEGNIYTRITNTTNDVFEKRMAALEGGVAAVSTASGTAAIFLAVTNICGPGDNIVTSPFLYGGTFTMFEITLRDMGIQVRFADSDRVEDLEKLVDERTKAIYLEILGNPAFNVPDFEPIVDMARKKGVCVMVDNTFGCGGYLFQPFSWGANVSVHSATKWICGHGTALGGVVVDGGNFDWTPEKYPLLAAPAESYHGLVYKEVFGNAAFAGRVRVDGLRNIGASASPFNSFLMLQGLETLSLRGFGAVLTFRVKGGFDAAAALVSKLELILHVSSVGDSKSLIVHPASTTHSQLGAQEQIACGVYPNLLRLSVGTESVDDLIYDLGQALK